MIIIFMRILNELEYAEKLIKNGFSRFMSMSDLIILAKYYRYFGKKKSEIRKELCKFCEKHAGEFSSILSSLKIEKAIARSREYPLRVPKDVPITERELESIRSLNNYRYEKILFTMLVLGKYFRLMDSKSKSKEYYIGENANTIHRLAHTVKKRNEDIFYILYKKGFINNIKLTDSFVLTFTTADDDSEPKIIVKDISNIISFYPPYCKICGKEFSKVYRSQNMCIECQKLEKNTHRKTRDKKRYRLNLNRKKYLCE